MVTRCRRLPAGDSCSASSKRIALLHQRGEHKHWCQSSQRVCGRNETVSSVSMRRERNISFFGTGSCDRVI
eukprot:3158496-Prymnesium_polylepis.1